MYKRAICGTYQSFNALQDNAQASVFSFVTIAVDHFLY